RSANDVKASCNVVVTSELNILFVGNSFTYDSVWWLPGILHAAGIVNVNMAYMYLSSSVLKQHVSGYASSVGHTCYRAVSGSSAWTNNGTTNAIKDIVKEREWNVISIQEYTGRAASWSMTSDVKATIEQWIHNVKSDQQGRPELAYIMSQAFGNPDVIGPYELMK